MHLKVNYNTCLTATCWVSWGRIKYIIIWECNKLVYTLIIAGWLIIIQEFINGDL